MAFFRSYGFRLVAGTLGSLLLPGVGHILARRWSAGARLLAIWLALECAAWGLMRMTAPTPAGVGPVLL